MSKPDHKQRMKDIKTKMRTIDKRYENFLEEIKLPVVKSIEQHPQPATFETPFFNNVYKFLQLVYS
jgi:hypothetical protein